MSGDIINPTEIVATLINQEESFQEGIKNAQELIDASCSILLLTKDGIYAARDKYGRTPVVYAVYVTVLGSESLLSRQMI